MTDTRDGGVKLPLPATFKERRDGSCLLSFGDHARGAHLQFDVECDAQTCAQIVRAVNANAVLVRALETIASSAGEFTHGDDLAQLHVRGLGDLARAALSRTKENGNG